MISIGVLFCFYFLHLIHGQLQINLHLTDWVSNDTNNQDLQHDCLYVAATIESENDPRLTISFCMSEWPSKWIIEENHFDKKFTFTQLSKQHITSQQLYLWSAPMDIIENYQVYLNQLPNSESTSMATQFFYNCTLPYFGPKCQYVLNYYKTHHSSLNQIVKDYYCDNRYKPATMTCYTHLQCNRGPAPACLDWTEICNGKVDCLDGEYDEEHCWKLEIHECNENEYRCSNGQCIPQEFVIEYTDAFDCLDRSDEPRYFNAHAYPTDGYCFRQEPTFKYEDISCLKFFSNLSTSLTSSCFPYRGTLLLQAMFSIKPKAVGDECWTAFKCIIGMPSSWDSLCQALCFDGTCDELARKTCPDIFYATATPVLLGHVFLAYEKNQLIYGLDKGSVPIYICYNSQRLHLPDDNQKQLPSINETCRFYNNSQFSQDYLGYGSFSIYIDPLYKWLHMSTYWVYNDSIVCNTSIMYQCNNTNKCISKSRLFDDTKDCFYQDDEDISRLDTNCSTKQFSNVFKCQTTNKCIPYYLFYDKQCDCAMNSNGECDDEKIVSDSPLYKIVFPIICDGLKQLLPRMIDGENHTDETECHQWPCNNIYTHCDGFWHCPNGADELNCDTSPFLSCPRDNHLCVSFVTKELTCLPVELANDGNIDCIGAFDEPTLCRTKLPRDYLKTFYCKNQSCIHPYQVCDRKQDCTSKEDEQTCKSNDFLPYDGYGICANDYYRRSASDITKVLCKSFLPQNNILKYGFLIVERNSTSSETELVYKNSRLLSSKTLDQSTQFYQQRCHRGFDVQVWLNKEKNLTRNTCLCPPSFYGDICQFQNQRISLTIQFRVTSDSVQTPFVIIISLIDDSDERTIHSFEQLTYLSKKFCQKKFNFYLIYSIRPKNETYSYFIHIDIYEKIDLIYRASVIKALLFPFLPVQRLTFQLDIPPARDIIDSGSNQPCVHGQYRRYSNDPNNTTFCQCHQGWSGRSCTIKYTCSCSSGSLCLGLLANNRSLCICRSNKMGHRCLLNSTACQIDQDKKCLNDGQCITSNPYGTLDDQFICICQKGYIGDRCEIAQKKIIITFDKNMVLPSSILIHFIRVNSGKVHDRATTYKIIPFGQYSTTIYWSIEFHIIFIELTKNNYYFTFLQINSQSSAVIETTVHSSNHCLSINEFFNETIVNLDLLRRIKYYQLPCQRNFSQYLSCFYDDMHLCMCQDLGQERVANCFRFDHQLKMNCFGQSGCENGGECYQDDIKCPQTSLCACPVCFYGTRCQLSTSGFSLSLDAILGYHIRPNIKISHQPGAVLLSLILSVVSTLGGLTNGVISLITFKDKKLRDVGCGIYLLCSSINTLLLMIIFLLKVWILVFSQIGSITSRLFLSIQCISFDFLLRFCLTIDQWLTACVAIERAYITIQGVNCNKKKIKFTAKLVIIALVLIAIGTSIHDPISRSLFDENNDEEKRIWCIVKYSSPLQIVNLTFTIFHIVVPFIINFISAIIIIIMKTRQRAVIKKQQKYNELLKEQFQQHKNLLIGPMVLMLLAIPRLIISFASGCMKSTRDSWLFLLGYFISFIPPLLTFILFILPSSVYYEVFRAAISRYRNIIARRG